MASSIDPQHTSEKSTKESFIPSSDLDTSTETSSNDVEKAAQKDLEESHTGVDKPRQVVGFKVCLPTFTEFPKSHPFN